ncbi:hypothetical protein [Streptomyces sp. NBC_01006]|uniref:hypothetical protein n=1 Tax=Streptomyces sp. NBC_01006 TaxID=2903716 RepID=UPI003865DD5C|nr:hypothetical protein OG509_00560 [Streptomyces sp. NBC_01006]
MEATEFVAAVGGPVDPAGFPAFMSEDAVEACRLSLMVMRAQLADFDRAVGVRTTVELVDSPFFTCRAKEIAPDHHVITIPLGLVCRFYVLADLLCGYLLRSTVMLVLEDVDAKWESLWRLPRGLHPLFGAPDTRTDWRKELEVLHSDVCTPEAAYDVASMTSLALMFVIGHEAAHVYRRHGPQLRAMKRLGVVRTPEDERYFRRFAETDADVMATHWVMLAQDVGRITALEGGREFSAVTAYFRLSYAVTALYALFDVHRKHMGSYLEGIYAHPMVRRHVFSVAGAMTSANEPETYAVWPRLEEHGWLHCAFGLNGLNIDTLMGKFGKVPKGYNAVPVSSLHYDPQSMLAVQVAYEREMRFYAVMAACHEGFGTLRMGTTPEAVKFEVPDGRIMAELLQAGDPAVRAAHAMSVRAEAVRAQ